jgi:hypothetical protein
MFEIPHHDSWKLATPERFEDPPDDDDDDFDDADDADEIPNSFELPHDVPILDITDGSAYCAGQVYATRQ